MWRALQWWWWADDSSNPINNKYLFSLDRITLALQTAARLSQQAELGGILEEIEVSFKTSTRWCCVTVLWFTEWQSCGRFWAVLRFNTFFCFLPLRTWQLVWMILVASTSSLKRALRWLPCLWPLLIPCQIMWTWSPLWRRYDFCLSSVDSGFVFYLHVCVCLFFFSETDGRCASPLGPGHPAGELYFQQEIVGLPGWGLQCSKCCRCSVKQPLPCAGHCQCSGPSHSVPQPANPAGTDVASHAGYSTLNGF